jgi:hypothetical protein
VPTKVGVRTLLIESEKVLPRDSCVFGAPSLTMLAQEGAVLEMGRLPGIVLVPASLQARPATPIVGEAGGKLLQHTTPSTIDPRRGGGTERGGGETHWW